MPSIVTAGADHEAYLAKHLRQVDVDEIQAASGSDPRAALCLSRALSDRTWTMLDDEGNPFAMFGVAPWQDLEGLGSPWLLASPAIETHRFFFLRACRPYIDEMHRLYPCLANYIDVRNRLTLRWLNWLGFEVQRFEPMYGFERRPFLLFTRYQESPRV